MPELFDKSRGSGHEPKENSSTTFCSRSEQRHWAHSQPKPRRFRLKTWDWIDDPARKRHFNDALFTEVARRYPVITRVLSLGRDASWKRRLIQFLPSENRPRCVDLACGTADLTFALARRYPAGSIVGLDLCGAMLVRARALNKFDSVTFVRADMGDCPIADESVDVVTGGYALRNAPSLSAVVAEVHRMLRPGGIAAFLDFSKPPNAAVQKAQYLLLYIWGGFWGVLLHRNPEVYAYIAKSLQRFPDRDRYHALLQQQGLQVQQTQRFYGGMLEVTVVQKIPRSGT